MIGSPNPFRGLRPFEAAEAHLFFGRKTQIADLLERLYRHRFLAVVGSSGCGKSSLVRAGVIAALHEGFMAADGPWRIAIMRPGDRPITALAAELKAPGALGDGYPTPDAGTLIGATLRRGALGIVDAVRQSALPAGTKLFLLVDQFEELFRFRQDPDRGRATDLAMAFVALLLEASAQRELEIYVAITMRSEYLGLCDAFAGLPEAINEGLYLVPRMTREQVREAIEEPIRRSGGEISARLVDRLLNDLSLLEQASIGAVGERHGLADEEGTTRAPDQLPVLQHALTRLWAEGVAERPEGPRIDLPHYERIGRLGTSLSNDADQCLASLSGRGREIARLLFRRLTEVTPDGRSVRRECRLSEICDIAAVAPPDVVAVIDPFRDEGRSFLMPPQGVPLTPETVIDISHESLIRQWGRLREWADDEARSAVLYRRLAHDAQRWQQGEGSLWRNPELAQTLRWSRSQKPTAAWAARYGGDFALALDFLRRSRRRNYFRASVSAWGALALLALLAVSAYWVLTTWVPTGIAYHMLLRGGPGFFRPEGASGVVEARDWVAAQLAWNRRDAARAALQRLLDAGSVELLLTAPGTSVGEERDAGAFLALFREAAESTGDDAKRRQLLSRLAPALARTGNVTAALDVATSFANPEDQLLAFKAVLENLAPGGEDGALEIARRWRETTRSTQNPVARARLLGELVSPLWRVNERAALDLGREAGRVAVGLSPLLTGDLEAAERLVVSVQGEPDRDDRLREIARGWAADGRVDRARELVERVSPESRDQARADVARTLSRQGQPGHAVELAALVQSEGTRETLLQEIAAVFAQRGQDDAARRAIERIGQPDAKGEAWTSVARTYCGAINPPRGANTLDDALQQAGTVVNPISRSRLLDALTCALARRGDAQAARRAADMIAAPSDRVRALLRVAREGGRAGSPAAAEEALQQAQAILREAEPLVGPLPGLRSDLARVQADRGDTKGAVETAKGIKNDLQSRWQAFASVAVAYARERRIRDARAIITEQITDDTARLHAYARVLMAWKSPERTP